MLFLQFYKTKTIMDYGLNFDIKDIDYYCYVDWVWKTEEWKYVPGYEDVYMISDLGRVKSFKKNNKLILKASIASSGYRNVGFYLNKKLKVFLIHQLVAIAFLGHKPSGYDLVINHKNLKKLDNRKLNLEIVTNRENSNRKHIKSISKYVGVTMDKRYNKWVASIKIKEKRKHLGYFFCEKEASDAYQNKLNEIIDKKL